MTDHVTTIRDALSRRFGESPKVPADTAGLDSLARIAGRRVHRRTTDKPVDADLLRLLCACALSAPSKSDLQQADIVIVDKPEQTAIADLIPDQPFIRSAPAFLVFLASGRRLPEIARMRGKPFPNDHLDQFFNAAVDAAIVMTTFIRAATAVGLGCCPISAIRDHPARVSELLRLPERAVPVAGLCVGWPAQAGVITPRLSLETTLHENAYGKRDVIAEIDRYDRRRATRLPYRKQRDTGRWGEAPFYGWSEDKARQYAEPTRTDFGAFVRQKGFRLD
jgi:FMN reductase [NAD(P)H]